MKTRNGYVSNSSSSSFLVCCNDLAEFDFLKSLGKKYYNSFIRDMNMDDHHGDDRIRDFLANEYERTLYEYRQWLRYRHDKSYTMRTLYEDYADPALRLVMICHRLHNDSDEVKQLVQDGVDLARASVPEVQEWYDGKVGEMAVKFAELLLAEARKSWKIVSEFSYADEDGEFGWFMEHEFMGEVMHSEQESNGGYSVVCRNEH